MGCISRDRVYPLVRVDSTINGHGYKEVLKKFFDTTFGPPRSARTTAGRVPLNWTFMHGNASVHTANVAQHYLKQWRMKVLPWPSNSPDLNPIENLWSDMVRCVYDKSVYPTADALWTAVQSEWLKIGHDILHKLYDSMPSRLDAVVKAKGFPTKY